MEPLEVLLVDDEPLSRAALRRELEQFPEVRIRGECPDAHQALEEVRRRRPQVIFLDVRMPELDGLSFVRRLPADRRPAVIFVTAYDCHAVEAFEVAAADYLCKPVEAGRLRQALRRARRWLRAEATEPDPPLTLHTRRGRERLDVARIDWIEAADNYVRLYAGTQIHLVRSTLREMARRLPAQRFVQIHRCTMVNLDAVMSWRSLGHGDSEVQLRDGKRLRVSRTRREQVLARLDPDE